VPLFVKHRRLWVPARSGSGGDYVQLAHDRLDDVCAVQPALGRLLVGDGANLVGLEDGTDAARNARLALGHRGRLVGKRPEDNTATIPMTYTATVWLTRDGDLQPDADAYWSSSSEITIRRGGYYDLTGFLGCSTGAIGTLYGQWQRNGVNLGDEGRHSGESGRAIQATVSEPWVRLEKGDVLRLMHKFDSAATSWWTASRVVVEMKRWSDDMSALVKGLGTSVAAGLDETWLTLQSNPSDIATTTLTEVMRITNVPPGAYIATWELNYQSSATGTGVKVAIGHSGTTTKFLQERRFTGTGTTASTGAATGVAAGATGNVREGATSRTNGGAIGTATVSVDAADTDLMMTVESRFTVSVTGDVIAYLASETGTAVRAIAGTRLKLERAS
jgi:hypothetical protein